MSTETREDSVYLAKLAEQAERYEGECSFVSGKRRRHSFRKSRGIKSWTGREVYASDESVKDGFLRPCISTSREKAATGVGRVLAWAGAG